jgi:uncharacterized protein (TIRG00374 family)
MSEPPASAPLLGPRLGWIAGALLFAALLLVVTHRSEEREIARLLREARPVWLLAAAALQVATYVCAAAVWQRALARSGAPVPLARLVPLGLAKLFTDQAVPSAGMSGTVLVVRALERRGVARDRAVGAVLTGLFAFYLGYLVATALAVAALAARGEVPRLVLLPAAAICVLAAGLPLAVLALRRRARERPPGWLERRPGVRDVAAALRATSARTLLAPRTLAETTLLQLAIFALDALTLAATLRAVASPLELRGVFASFVIASAVSTLAWVPGGLGTFEATAVALLHLHGASVESAFAATLLLRAASFWAPMIPGFFVARRETAGGPVREVAREPA